MISKDYERVIAVIESCKNIDQLETAKRMLFNFVEKYKDELTSADRQQAMIEIQKLMDECIARIEL